MKPCKYGHISGRTKNSHCIECRNIRNKEYYAANSEKQKEYQRKYREDMPSELVKIYCKRYYERNRDKLLAKYQEQKDILKAKRLAKKALQNNGQELELSR